LNKVGQKNGNMKENVIIEIDSWLPDDEYDGVFPKGARDKSVYFSPVDCEWEFIKSNHRYLFKQSIRRHPYQFWVEIIAYRLGQLMDVEVPPAYIAFRNEDKVYGTLIEWFYTRDENYEDGGNIMRAHIKPYDSKKGTQHNLETILKFTGHSIENKIEHWAKVFAFDTVIGNTDRHHDNWGLVYARPHGSKTDKKVLRYSPAFDNGTAMGYEILEKNFYKFDDSQYLHRYLTKKGKARHHMKWRYPEVEPSNFFDFMKRFVEEFPESKDTILKCLDFSHHKIEKKLTGLVPMVSDEKCKLTEKRLKFFVKLITIRANILKEILTEKT